MTDTEAGRWWVELDAEQIVVHGIVTRVLLARRQTTVYPHTDTAAMFNRENQALLAESHAAC